MRPVLVFCFCCLSAMRLFGQEILDAPLYSLSFFSPDQELLVGVPVTLTCNAALDTERLSPGQSLPCTANMAVWTECDIVIAPGAPATIRVKAIVPSTANDPEMLVLEAVSVGAVDGQEVSLMGELTIRGKYPNESLVMEAGTLLPAQVSKELKIKR